MSARLAVEQLIYRSALSLDDGDFTAYLARCDAQFRYLVTAYSPEIRRDMTWLDHDKAGIALLFETLPRHNSDLAPLSRHVTVYTVDVNPEGTAADAVSALQVFRTGLDGGGSELFAVGKIHDSVRLDGDAPRLTKRHIKLQTRMLGIGTHIPL